MVPGTISWAVLILPLWLSFSYPWLVAYFVLSFDFYWLCRALWFAAAVIVAYQRIRRVRDVDWTRRVSALAAAQGGAAVPTDDDADAVAGLPEDATRPRAEDLIHLALIPTYTEPLDKLRDTVRALAEAEWPRERKICAIITRETDTAGRANVAALRDLCLLYTSRCV